MFRRLGSLALFLALGAGCHTPDRTAPDAGQTATPRDAATDADLAGFDATPDAGSPAPEREATPAAGSGAVDAGAAPDAGSARKPAGERPTTSSEPAASPDNTVSEIATTGLQAPSDLAWNPYAKDELWVVNHADSSATIISNATGSARTVLRRLDPEGARHFMPSPTSLAFGGRETSLVDASGQPVIGTFATCPENAESFMGPTLWTPDLRIFGIAKSERQPPFNGEDTGAEGPGSHLDMLHRTPDCLGIAWEGTGNLYWTYSGSGQRFVRYDFGKDHGIGNADHTDGSVWRYAVSGIGYLPGVPAHLAYDARAKRVYMADPAHARVISFDPASAATATEMSSADNVDYLQVALDMAAGQVADLVPASYGLVRPSGLELHGDHLYVSDTATSTIHKLTTAGKPVSKVQLPGVKAGGLAGLAFGPDDRLYFVDMVGSRVLRLEAAF